MGGWELELRGLGGVGSNLRFYNFNLQQMDIKVKANLISTAASQPIWLTATVAL